MRLGHVGQEIISWLEPFGAGGGGTWSKYMHACGLGYRSTDAACFWSVGVEIHDWSLGKALHGLGGLLMSVVLRRFWNLWCVLVEMNYF